jgi:hypothetical protein
VLDEALGLSGFPTPQNDMEKRREKLVLDEGTTLLHREL